MLQPVVGKIQVLRTADWKIEGKKSYLFISNCSADNYVQVTHVLLR